MSHFPTSAEAPVRVSVLNKVLLIELSGGSPENLFTRASYRLISDAFLHAEEERAIEAVIITGGPGRSFSAGIDFNAEQLQGGQEVDEWLEAILAMYDSCLRCTKPVVAAIDLDAASVGLQLALLCDWRIGTERCRLSMPDLRHGSSATIGSLILELTVGRAAMMELIYGEASMPPRKAVAIGLLSKVVPVDALIDEAQQMAEQLACYPRTSFACTKRFLNERICRELEAAVPAARQALRTSFAEIMEQRTFRRTILTGDSPR